MIIYEGASINMCIQAHRSRSLLLQGVGYSKYEMTKGSQTTNVVGQSVKARLYCWLEEMDL